MISAGEVSGDIHGTYLVQALKKLDPSIYFFGMGSEKLLAEGVDVKFDLTKRGSIGIFEALPNVIPIYIIYRKLVALLKKEKPDLLILVDSQGINMPLAKAAKKLGIKTVYYIAPQEWLWGTEKGVKKVIKAIDQIISIFEKEHGVYQKAGGNSVYFGHPLIDIVKPSLSKEETKEKLVGAEKDTPVIAICPGSRRQEIKSLLPVMLSACEIIHKQIPKAKFIIPAASTNMIQGIFNMISDDFRPLAIVGHTYDILNAADLALCASGTINLEASILGVPNIMVYKLSPLTYFVGKHFLKLDKKLKYFSMPNMLLDRMEIPELTMEKANPKQIAEEALSILYGRERQQNMRAAFSVLKTKLGEPGVISRTATAILNS